MVIEFGAAKDALNIKNHGISLSRFADIDEASALYTESTKPARFGGSSPRTSTSGFMSR